MGKPSPKSEARREKFRKIGQAISAMKKVGDPNAPDYHTGKRSSFEMSRFDAQNRDATDPLNKSGDTRTEIPYGPSFKTPQWSRTIR